MTHVNLPSKEWVESIFNNRIFQQIKTNYQDPFRLGPGIQPNSSSLFEKGYGFGIKEYFGKEIKDFFNEDRTGAQSAKKEEQKATITVKFKDAPAGTRVISMDGTAKVLVDMGYAGIGIA
jgi:hypothetical protein